MKRLVLALVFLSSVAYGQELKPGTYEQDLARGKAAMDKNRALARKHLAWAVDAQPNGREANFLLGQLDEKTEKWEAAEKHYAVCLAQASTDTIYLENHAWASLNCLYKHPNKPNPSFNDIDYLPLVVKDYDTLIAAGHTRNLLERATAYRLRASFSSLQDAATAKLFTAKALADVTEFEKQHGRTEASIELRQQLLALN